MAMQDLGATPMICSSAPMQQTKLYMEKVALSDCNVLITGETGTGKELAAEFIHNKSPRRNKPLVCINCAAIPDTLLESELFGYAKGAFTGADNTQDGLLASADGGTVFLDEVGDMSPLAQAKVLRVIERREVCRLGGRRQVRLDLRFVAASNQDLESMTNRGSFRKDLFFRLNVARIHLPPLRERKEDIPLLLDHYCRGFGQRSGRSAPEFSQECLRCLLHYDWPGNIRELKNLVERLFLNDLPQSVSPDQLPDYVRGAISSAAGIAQTERDLLLSALFSAKWNKSKAAEGLHWSRMTLYRKLAKYRIGNSD
jgi:DNA-binding NtrC family response regulator